MAGAILIKRAATYEDLCEVPDHLVAEILDGDLFTSPRPSIRHAHVASTLGSEVGGPFHQGRGGPGGWWVLDEPELHLRDDVVVPDLAGWRRTHLPALPDAAFITLAPDWICEVLSPSTASLDRLRKLRIYAREGVSYAWLLDPAVRTFEVLRLENGRWSILAMAGGPDIVNAEPFESLALELGRLWPDDPVSGW